MYMLCCALDVLPYVCLMFNVWLYTDETSIQTTKVQKFSSNYSKDIQRFAICYVSACCSNICPTLSACYPTGETYLTPIIELSLFELFIEIKFLVKKNNNKKYQYTIDVFPENWLPFLLSRRRYFTCNNAVLNGRRRQSAGAFCDFNCLD